MEGVAGNMVVVEVTAVMLWRLRGKGLGRRGALRMAGERGIER